MFYCIVLSSTAQQIKVVLCVRSRSNRFSSYCVFLHIMCVTGGGCRLCNPDNGDARTRQLQTSSSYSSSSSSYGSVSTSSSSSGTNSYSSSYAWNGVQTSFSSSSTFMDYTPLLEMQLELYLTAQVVLNFGFQPGHCLYGNWIVFDVELEQSTTGFKKCWIDTKLS